MRLSCVRADHSAVILNVGEADETVDLGRLVYVKDVCSVHGLYKVGDFQYQQRRNKSIQNENLDHIRSADRSRWQALP